ncbi:hypothetical protein [Pleomorphomonas oryzae]|uniref:hypothetical protein n=1 Tax=Pleomorphomonas oryzae TaxID=261934 RepID=UPI00047DD04D|nr:hypothetical protein [Pleomorphomonas oryzae]
MSGTGASEEAKRRAFEHVVSSIDLSTSFPAQVFLGSWDAFFFFEPDHLFIPEFATFMAGLLNAEGAEVCCLLNFSKTERTEYGSADMLFIDAETKPDEYGARLREGGPASGWLYVVDFYGSASDRGRWCIYCERWNEIAVIALRQSEDVEKYRECLERVYAEPISALLRADSEGPYIFSQLIDSWRQGLVQNYDGPKR